MKRENVEKVRSPQKILSMFHNSKFSKLMTASELSFLFVFGFSSSFILLNKRINIEIGIIVFKHFILSCLLQWTYHFLLHHHSVWHGYMTMQILAFLLFFHPLLFPSTFYCLTKPKSFANFKCHSILCVFPAIILNTFSDCYGHN